VLPPRDSDWHKVVAVFCSDANSPFSRHPLRSASIAFSADLTFFVAAKREDRDQAATQASSLPRFLASAVREGLSVRRSLDRFTSCFCCAFWAIAATAHCLIGTDVGASTTYKYEVGPP
jgi:hypothetical protein